MRRKEGLLSTAKEVVVRHKAGLHARPAATLVKTAGSFTARITVENLTKGTSVANAKSILSILKAAVQQNDRVRITAEGDDAEEAVARLCGLIESNFGEPE